RPPPVTARPRFVYKRQMVPDRDPAEQAGRREDVMYTWAEQRGGDPRMPRSLTRGALVALGAGLSVAAMPAAAQKPVKAPAFSAADLVTLPSRNWITNGGNIYNQRYSTLSQINRDNVKDVKAVWRVSL